MPQAVDEKGDIYELDAQGNPIRHLGNVNSQGGTMGTPKTAPAKEPYRFKDNDGNVWERGDDGVNRIVFRDTPKTAAAKPLRQGDGDKLEADVAQYVALRDSLRSFNKDYGGNFLGGAENALQAITPDFLGSPGTPGQRDWWAAFKNTDNVIRNGLYGASLTAGEKAAYDATTVTPAMKPEEITRNLTRRAELIRNAVARKVNRFRAAGYNGDEINAITGEYGGEIESKTPNPFLPENEGEQKLPAANVGPDGIQRSTMVGAQYNGGPTGGGIATGTSKSAQIPPEMQAEFDAFLKANPRGKLDPNAYAAKRLELNAKYGFGINPDDLQTYMSEGKAYNERLNVPFNTHLPPADVKTSAIERGYGAVFTNPYSGPVLSAAATGLNGLGMGIPELAVGQNVFGAIHDQNPKSAFLGDMAGSVGGVGTISKGLVKTGLAKDLPQALLRANLGYGAIRGATGNPDNPVTGAVVGTAIAGAGEGVGRGIVAPAVKAIAQSRGGQAVGNSVRGIFGKRQMPVVAPLSQPEQMIVSAVGDTGPQTMGNLREASRLGLPFTLADANPNLRALAGSAVRKSPNVRQLAEDTLRPRAVGQIDRLQSAITRDFGSPANIPERSDALIEQARNASRPFYEQAYSAPGASSVNVEDILQTPLGKAALERARTQAMNDRMDPTALGIDLNDIGEPVLTRVPSFETLDRVKKAFDDIANEGRTPFGTFQPNAEQATAARLADDLRTRIDEVNPAYAQARSAFAGPAGEREALTMGTKAGNQSADQVGYTLKNLSPARAQQYRLGALSDISERANRVRYNSNPYEAIAGSPESRARLNALWPQGAPRFTRQADLEADMGRTFTEALGGSPTQARNMADQAFDVGPVPAAAIDMANGFMTGSPPVATLSRVGGNFLKDAYRLGLGQKKADAIGPVLLNPNAAQVAQIFSDIRKNAIKSGMLGRKAAKQGKTVGDITASMFAAPATSYLLGQ